MKPVRTANSNMVYLGPTPDVGDLHCQRIAPGHIRAIFALSPEEPAAIAAGGNVMLTLLREPIPPVALNVTGEQGVGEDAPEVEDRIRELRVVRDTGDEQDGDAPKDPEVS